MESPWRVQAGGTAPDAGLDRIRRLGTGADRQRAAYGSAGRIEDVLAAVTEPSAS